MPSCCHHHHIHDFHIHHANLDISTTKRANEDLLVLKRLLVPAIKIIIVVIIIIITIVIIIIICPLASLPHSFMPLLSRVMSFSNSFMLQLHLLG